MKLQLIHICVALLVISGCNKKNHPSPPSVDNNYYYMLIGNIQLQNDIPSASGMPFDSPVIIFVNDNPVTVTTNPGMSFITSYMVRKRNTISIRTDTDQKIEIGIYYQDSNTISKEIYKTQLTSLHSKATFKIDKVASNFRLLPSNAKLPVDSDQSRQELFEVIKALHETIETRNGKQAVNKLFAGRTNTRKHYDVQHSEHELNSLNSQIKNYSRTDFNVKSVDSKDIDFIWGKTMVLAYNKRSIGKPFSGLFDYDIPENAEPMPIIENLKFIFMNGQWVIW